MGVKKKVVMIGDSSVGKTSCVRRFVLDLFEDSYISTIGAKVTRKDVRVPDPDTFEEEDLTMMIWDIIGREGFTSFHAKAFAGAKGALLVCDLTREETLHTLERYWIPLLLKVAEGIPLVFAGNKFDLKDDITYPPKKIEEIALRHNLPFEGVLPGDFRPWYVTSAKTGQNVQKAFETLGRLMLSGRAVSDPLKDLFDSVVAMDVSRKADRTTILGVLDAVTVDFWEWANGKIEEDAAFKIVRAEYARAGMNVIAPTKDALQKVVEFLAEAEAEYLKGTEVRANRERRMEWANDAKE